ncbi:hypothetical protein Q7P37_007749 [Cladosporium fusiforme]
MKFPLSLICGLTSLATAAPTRRQAPPCLEFSFTLEASFAGTNNLFYNLKADGEEVCAGNEATTGFGQSEFSVTCSDDWSFELDVDAFDGDGKVTVPVTFFDGLGQNVQLHLKQTDPDMQFGCGNTLCVGIKSSRASETEC